MNEQTADLWREATETAIAYRRDMPDMPVLPTYDAKHAHQIFGGPLAVEGMAANQVIEEIVSKSEGGLLQTTSPRFFGFVIGASHPVGVAADFLTSAWGNFGSFAEETPAVTAMENVLCDWVADILDLPKNCGAGVVTGATIANSVGIITARNALLNDMGWDVEADGLFGAPQINVVLGEEAHSAVFAGLRYAGFGAKRVVKIATDDQARMSPDALAAALEGLSGPTLLILQTGSINSGDSDEFEKLIPIAKKHGAWVHIDGAFGLWLKASPKFRHLTDGVEMADSWAVDLHKWLNAPYDAAIIFCRDRAPMVKAMSAKGAYLPGESAFADPSDTVMELSRRARGIPSYAILKTLGKNGVAEMITRHCELAIYLADKLTSVDGITINNDVVANQVSIRCGEGEMGEAQTTNVLKLIHDRANCFPSAGFWKGHTTIRVSIVGHATQRADIDVLIDEITQCWNRVKES